MSELAQMVVDAVKSLAGTRWPIVDAHANVPHVPGLYAVYGTHSAWTDLKLTEGDVARPLYVGKAEDSFVSRDLRTHFASGRTGQSTVRRSFAALLRESLHLHGIPRNPEKPGHFANFGLSPENDSRLTSWMWSNLSLAVWPTTGALPLRAVEAEVVKRLDPPLNIEYLPRNSRTELSAARRAMADEARQWASLKESP
jgi:hypothetical protein